MAISEVSICNQALSWLGGNRITSLDDDSREAQLCKDNYETLRDATLEAADWSFAIQRFRATPLAAVPAYGYTAAFQISPNVLRVINPITSDADGLTRIRDWAREGKKILCDESVIYYRGICVIDDPSQFSRLFSQALSARIAAEISRPLTNKADKTLWELYARKLGDAMASDGMQGVNQKPYAGKLINARMGGYSMDDV